jgi:hypothetical protein
MAGTNFTWFWLVLRGQAAHCIGDTAAAQVQSWVGISSRIQRFGTTGKTVFMQRAIQQLACKIAAEWPTGAVRAVHPGSQSNNQKLAVFLTERTDR